MAKEPIKISTKQLRDLIKEEFARVKKIKTLKEEKSRIDSLLKEMEGMEEYAEMQPSDVPGAAAPAPAADPKKMIDGAAAVTSIIGVDAMNAVEKMIMKSPDHKKAAEIVSIMDKGEQKLASLGEAIDPGTLVQLMDVAKITAFLIPAILSGGWFVKEYLKKSIAASKADPNMKKKLMDTIEKVQVEKK